MNRTTNNLVCSILLLTIGLSPFAKAGDTRPSPAQDAPTESKAISFPFSYTGEGLANLSGGYKRGAIAEGLLNAGVQGDLDKLLGWQGGSFLVSGIYAHGPSLTDNYVRDLNRVSNIDAYDSMRLYEAWVQQEFAEGAISLRVGQILADTEFFVSDAGALFLNGAFGAIPVVSLNFNTPAFPVAAPGARVRWTATPALSVQAAIFSGDAGDPATSNRHGLDWRLNRGVLAITEVAYQVNAEKESQGLRGVYKLGAFFHGGEADERFPDASSRANGGGYFVADQQLWRKPGSEAQGLSGFLRIGAAPADRNTVPLYFDTGFNYKGLLPGRDHDIAGIALSYTNLSGNACDDAGIPPATHHETILEMTYKAVINDSFSVQPDFQYLFNPGGTGSAPDAVVIGLRCNLVFP